MLWIALDEGNGTQFGLDRGFEFKFVVGHVQGGFQSFVDIGGLKGFLPGMGKVLQVQHDFLDAFGAFAAIADQVLGIVEQKS